MDHNVFEPLPALEYRRDLSEHNSLWDLRTSIQLFALATVAAFLSSLPMFVALELKVVLLVLGSGLFQGFLLGRFLIWILKTMRVRKQPIAFVVSVYASTVALILIHVAFYLRDVEAVHRIISNGSSRLAASFPLSRGGPFSLYNRFIQQQVGVGGFTGYAIYRMRNSFYATSTIVLLVATPVMTWRICKRQVSAAFCSSCAMWMGKSRNVSVVPAAARDFLVETVQSNDVEKAVALARAVADVPLGNSCAIARQYRCPSCDQLMIDVIQKRYTRRKQSQSLVLAPMLVSRDFADALRSDPVITVEDDAEQSVDAQSDGPAQELQ